MCQIWCSQISVPEFSTSAPRSPKPRSIIRPLLPSYSLPCTSHGTSFGSDTSSLFWSLQVGDSTLWGLHSPKRKQQVHRQLATRKCLKTESLPVKHMELPWGKLRWVQSIIYYPVKALATSPVVFICLADMSKEFEFKESSSVFPVRRFREQGNDRPTCSCNTAVPRF